MSKHALYDLNATEDLDAWDTHVIRSHKRQRKPSDRRAIAFFVAVCMSAIAVTINITSEPRKSPTHAQAAVPPSVALIGPDHGSETTTDTPDERRQREPEVSRAAEVKPSPVEIAISWALGQQGKRYAWGSAGPNSFDCSGLVMRAFEQIGIKLPHYTGTMMSYGKKVSRSELIRGDIVFPSSGHVVLYLGNNQVVAASSGKGKVVVQTLYSFYTARRLL